MGLTDLFSRLLAAVAQASDSVDSALTSVEMSIREELALRGVSPGMQTVVLLGLVFVITVVLARAFHGLIRFAIVLVMLAVAVHIATGSG